MEKDVLISIRGLQYLMDEESGEQEHFVLSHAIWHDQHGSCGDEGQNERDAGSDFTEGRIRARHQRQLRGGLRNRYRGKTAGRRKTEFIKKYPGRMKIIQLGYFREQRAKVRACTRPWRLPRKQKETRKACFFLLQMKFYFSSPRALRSIFCQKPFFFAGCSKEPRMPRTPVI